MENNGELVQHSGSGKDDRHGKDDGVTAKELVVSARDVSPGGAAEIRSIERSIKELVVCQTIFTQWMHELNKVTVTDEVQDGLETQVRATVFDLQCNSTLAVKVASQMLQSYKTLAAVMVRRMRRATEVTEGCLFFDDDQQDVAERIAEDADALSTHVEDMRENLKCLVSTIRVEATKKPTFWQSTWKWLKACFGAVCQLLSRVRLVAAFSFNQKTSKLESVVGSLFLDLEMTNGQPNDVTFDRVLRFLADTIPEQAQIAKSCLVKVQGYQIALQLQLHFRAGLSIKISFVDAEEAGDQWQLQIARLQLLRMPPMAVTS